ncbi:bifunctional 5,10-methylenetetrahydrofolate dehydrogenase/5,10-methenyltetrahydrofolate cyclohydrolase [Patescibacteria group bacterium]|nr:bifunctional 5,10-methylenetetrahydrofolate dehydrogenase/5,10-methenyltetrahydrofolate cyclohydrolase [Patescibacteria group bacterium]MBU4057561.1 bifunctional 5,10-methylenetetrahydrofolate dehydrogenase/5,10-methenyltetrahydrofolate cyclohydrolase [Patescibacteria group bacterium]MBU4115593.1 bifunctional 5,10-methylenetetrahydrofolate dehydrogenase/5,10-methenyltetrahydrofolate cyclohydrolase [Patescibacteria group bacterium]
MLVDGKKIADEIKKSLKEKVSKLGKKPNIIFVYVGENSVINKFVGLKQKFADEIGIKSFVKKFSNEISEKDLKKEIEKIISDENTGGIVIQLPLPLHINPETVLNLIPKEKDPDVLGKEAFVFFEKGESKILPPVIGVIKEIFDRYQIDFKNKKIVIIGKGKLVGLPASIWFSNQGIKHTALEKGDDILKYTKNADIIISGAGSPNLIKKQMIKNDVILIDAGTSELDGQIIGDINGGCLEKAFLFSSVPGGVGPITISKLFENFFILNKK